MPLAAVADCSASNVPTLARQRVYKMLWFVSKGARYIWVRHEELFLSRVFCDAAFLCRGISTPPENKKD